MKNIKLLLATTAILSATAMVANAADVTSTSLHTNVALVKSWNITELSTLDFGMFEAKNNGEIVMGTDGNATTELTQYTNLFSGNQGIIRISGNVADSLVSDRAIATADSTLTDQQRQDQYDNLNEKANMITWLSFTAPQPLKDIADDSIVCGTTAADSFTQQASVGTEGVNVYIGATLILANDIEAKIAAAKRGLNCQGSVTVTNIFDNQ